MSELNYELIVTRKFESEVTLMHLNMTKSHKFTHRRVNIALLYDVNALTQIDMYQVTSRVN